MANTSYTYIFNGEKILVPEQLQEVDSDISRMITLPELTQGLVRIRDVVKRMSSGETFMILGIENQTQIHYAIPLLTLLYDVLGYLKEYEVLVKTRKGEKGLTSSEYLSGMRKEAMPSMRNLITQHQVNLFQVRESGAYQFSNPDVKAEELVAEIIKRFKLNHR